MYWLLGFLFLNPEEMLMLLFFPFLAVVYFDILIGFAL